MPEQVERDYNMDDLDMLQRAQVFHNAFVGDQATFVADFPHLATPFETEFQTAIDAADAIPSAAEVDGEISAVTFELNEQLPLGRKALQKLYTYVELAWPKGQKDSAFGRPKYDKARQSQMRMKELLEQAHRQAEVADNKTALLAAGYTQAAIDELKTIETAIDTLNAQQEDMLAGRFEKTMEMITAYNLVWSFMQKINKASKVTFEDNPAKLEPYLLYPTSTTGLPKVQNLIASLGVGNPYDAELGWDVVVGATEYELYISEVATGQPAGTFSLANTVSNNQATFNMTPGVRYWFKVRAKNASQTGSFSDEVFLDAP